MGVSGADDRTVKVWDYLSKTCLQTLEGHTHNVSTVAFHPTLPLILSGSEDSTVRIWNSSTYRLEKTLNYGMERVWSLASQKNSNSVAIGYDEGTVMIKFGSEEPAISMDKGGKIIWSQQSSIQQVNTKTLTEKDLVDGERLSLATKELGTSEVFPQSLKHNNNGRFVVVCGDGEFIIYTALAWRNKSYGKAVEFVWGNDTGEYATRENTTKVTVFKNFKETHSFRPDGSAEGIFGGRLLGVRSNSALTFYDWANCSIIRKIEISPKSVYWSDSGDFVVIACDSSFYILRFCPEKVGEYLDSGVEVLEEIPERVRSALWVGDCFIYTNANRLNYCVGGEVVTLAHLEGSMYPIGYAPKQSRIYCADKSVNLVSYSLDLSIINYQTAILRDDFEAADQILPKIPMDQRNRIAQFLEKQGHSEMALNIATDPDLKFELALQLNKLNTAYTLAKEAESEEKWKLLGDSGLQNGEIGLARECFIHAEDLGGLLSLCIATGDVAGLEKVASKAKEEGQNNISFVSSFLMKDIPSCIELLCETGRIPEAAFLARTYMPSKISEVVALWKDDLKKTSVKAAESLADPQEYPNLFPELEQALQAEQQMMALQQSAPTPQEAPQEETPAPVEEEQPAQEEVVEATPEPEASPESVGDADLDIDLDMEDIGADIDVDDLDIDDLE